MLQSNYENFVLYVTLCPDPFLFPCISFYSYSEPLEYQKTF